MRTDGSLQTTCPRSTWLLSGLSQVDDEVDCCGDDVSPENVGKQPRARAPGPVPVKLDARCRRGAVQISTEGFRSKALSSAAFRRIRKVHKIRPDLAVSFEESMQARSLRTASAGAGCKSRWSPAARGNRHFSVVLLRHTVHRRFPSDGPRRGDATLRKPAKGFRPS
jgi:hypothetical protein